MSEEILVTVNTDECFDDFPPDEALRVSGFDIGTITHKFKNGLFSSPIIWWMGYASSKEDAINKAKENWNKTLKPGERRVAVGK